MLTIYHVIFTENFVKISTIDFKRPKIFTKITVKFYESIGTQILIFLNK
jgi:hypothetical protein